MTDKFRFNPFSRYAAPSRCNLERLNSIRSLYYAYFESDLPAEEISPEFYRAVGQVLMETSLEDLRLEYVEFKRPEQPETGKELVLSAPLLESQIRDLLDSNINEESKEGLHNLLGTLLDYSDEGVRKIRLASGSERDDAAPPRKAFETYGSFEEWVDAHKHSAPVIQTELQISLEEGNDDPSCKLKSYVMGLEYVRSEIDSEISESGEWIEYFEKKGDFSD